MFKRFRVCGFLAIWVLFLAASSFASQAAPAAEQVIKLPAPQMEGGRPLMQVLKDRQSNRAFKLDKLPLQVLSNLLWAADGVNRADSSKRTAPTAMNVQNMTIYAAMAEGLYTYDAVKNVLNLVVAEDLRGATGMQDFAKTVPLDLVYVADLSKLQRAPEETRMVWSAAHAGFIGQNVYLFCASEGLATVVRGSFDKDALAKAFKLGPDQRAILAQSVGYPAK